MIIFSLGNRLCFIGENLLPPRLLHRELNFPVPGRNCESQTKRWYDHQTGEIYLSDAINAYAHGRAVYGQVIHGDWYDTGNPSDYLVAQFASALAHPLYAPALRRLAHEIERADADPIGE